MTTSDRIDHDFRHHAPPNGDTVERLEAVRTVMRDAARRVLDLVPESRERSLAITKLEEAMFWANAGIARNPTVPRNPPVGDDGGA